MNRNNRIYYNPEHEDYDTLKQRALDQGYQTLVTGWEEGYGYFYRMEGVASPRPVEKVKPVSKKVSSDQNQVKPVVLEASYSPGAEASPSLEDMIDFSSLEQEVNFLELEELKLKHEH